MQLQIVVVSGEREKHSKKQRQVNTPTTPPTHTMHRCTPHHTHKSDKKTRRVTQEDYQNIELTPWCTN